MANLKHVGIIPDGNRRWALRNKMSYEDAYAISMNQLASLVKFSFDFGVKVLSIYLLSKDNLERQRDDVGSVIEAETDFVRTLLSPVAKEYKCKIVPVGNLSLLPDTFRIELVTINNDTHCYKERKIYLLTAYDPMDEINSVVSRGKISLKKLWVTESVSCVVRTAGGPTMLSKFLPLQSSYAQIFMIDKLFQDCNIDDFREIYELAAKTDMKYGK